MIDYRKFLETIESIREGSANAFLAEVVGVRINLDSKSYTGFLSCSNFLWASSIRGIVYWQTLFLELDYLDLTEPTKYSEVVF